MKTLKKNIFVFAILIFLFDCVLGSEYQAESGKLYKAVFETKNSGYTGTAYVNFDNEPGSSLEIKVGMQTSGEQHLNIRFANGTSNPRTLSVSLDDSVLLESVVFQPTGSWTQWDTLGIFIFIPEGIHTLNFISTGTEGGPNIDVFELSGIQLKTFDLDLDISGEGSIVKLPDYGLLFEGQEIQLIARPGFSHVFEGWTGDFTGTNDSISFTMDSNKKITARFQHIQLEIPEPDFSMTGYAAVPGNGLETTTGGATGKILVIETLDQLREWGYSREDNSSPETVIIKGLIEAPVTEVITIKRGANISVIGDSEAGGSYGELKNVSLNIRDYSNVIVQNLKIREVFYPDDGLTIDHCHHVWIDHCEFHSKIGSGIGVDTYDGLLDIKKGSRHVTVSWCYFHDHMKTVLIGHSDNNEEQDKDLQVTFHHNWFSNTDGRNPSLRFGQVHFYNNYLENISDYGFAVRNGAHAKIENCHFHSVNIPIATDKFEGHGFACISACLYTGTCSETDNEISAPFHCEFWNEPLPYPYTPEDVQTVNLSVQKYAGVGKINTITATRSFVHENQLKLLNTCFSKGDARLKINLFSDNSQEILISLISMEGKNIPLGSRYLGPGSQEIKINLPEVNPGIYLLNMYNTKNKVSKKIILN